MRHPPLTGEIGVIDGTDPNKVNLSDTVLALYGVTLRTFEQAEADPNTLFEDGAQFPAYVRKDENNWFRAVAQWNKGVKTVTLLRGPDLGTIGTGDTVSVSCDRGQTLALDASETISGEFADPRIGRTSVHQWLGTPREPVGFVNREDVRFSWDNATRTLSVFPASSEFTYFADSQRNTITGTVQVQVPDVTATYYTYLDPAGTLYQVTDRKEVENQDCPVVAIFWNATTQQVVPDLFDDAHQCSMSDATRDLLASTAGPAYESGMAVSAASEGSGNVDASAQFSMTAGYFWVEDMRVLVAENILTASIPVMWKESTTGTWNMALTPFLGVTAGSGRLAYNEFTGSAWQLTECGSNNYALAHLFSIPGSTHQSVIVVGQAEYSTVGDARTGAEIEIALLNAEGMPGGKALSVATFILQTHNSYTNPIKARIRATGEGEDFVDWRYSYPVSGAAASDHNNLAGLQGGQAGEYYHLTEAEQSGTWGPISVENMTVRSGTGWGVDVNRTGTGDGVRVRTEDGVTNNGYVWLQGANYVFNLYSGSDNGLRFNGYHQGTVTFLFNSNGSSYLNGGFLGLGTVSPAARFHAVSNAPGSYPFRLDNSLGAGIVLFQDVAGNGAVIVRDSAEAVKAQINATGTSYFQNALSVGTVSSMAPFTVNGHQAPLTTNSFDCGLASYAWRDLYVHNAPTQVSDRRAKRGIQYLGTDVYQADSALNLINDLRPVTYLWKDSAEEVETDPGEPERTEWRPVTRKVEKQKFDIELHEPSGQYRQKAVTVTVEEPVIDEHPLFDESGNPVMTTDDTGNPVQVIHRVQRMEEVVIPARSAEKQPHDRRHHRKHFGLIAQDVKQTLDRLDINTEDFAPYVEDENGNLSLRYVELVPLLIHGINILSNRVRTLEGAAGGTRDGKTTTTPGRRQ